MLGNTKLNYETISFFNVIIYNPSGEANIYKINKIIYTK